MTIAYYNGEFLPLNEVKVSAMDRGFLFGDSVYEVIPVYSGKLFRLEQHLTRLRQSLAAIRLEIAITDDELRTMMQELIAQNSPASEQGLYLQITRGPAPIRDFAFPDTIKPTIFAYCMPFTLASLDKLAEGRKAVTVKDIRWQRCNIKATTLLANVLMRQEAKDHDAQEAILINGDEAVEGSSSNLFLVINDTIVTPPQTNKILGGITRDLILELAAANHIATEQREVKESELFTANELWLTSSTKEIWPIVALNGKIVSGGRAGSMWRRMMQIYQNYKETFITQ